MSLKGEEALGAAIDYMKKSLDGAGVIRGQDGFSPVITENQNNTDDDYRLDITTASGTFTTPNLVGLQGEKGETGEKGDKGDKGDAGDAGEDGWSPENNAGAHNAIYRGKYLGSSVSSTQYAAIKAGTFADLYIGDYWTIGSIKYRIAAFDYYLNCGDTNCTTHHAVIVPDTIMGQAPMNDGLTNGSGYVGSAMYTTNLENAKTIIKSAFSGHVLSHRIYLVNSVTSGILTGCVWCDSEVDLMCEEMVYGTSIFRASVYSSTTPFNCRVEKTQLPLFAHEPSRICSNRWGWWLRDPVSTSMFAFVNGAGYAYTTNATNSYGVRPFFCISG